MKLGKLSKILVLFATLLPPVYMVVFVVGLSLSFRESAEVSPLFDNSSLFFAIHVCVMLLTFALLVFYIVFLFKTQHVKPELKALWAVVLFFGSPIAMPIFWFLHVWPSRQETPSQAIGGV